jgi:hypothetical protein
MSSIETIPVCGPLMAAAGALLYRRNPFRVTGLSVDVSVREISRQAARLQMILELGQAEAVPQSAFPLDPRPGLDEIRDAIEQIKDPQNRIVYEFFWLWPDEWGKSRNDPAIQAWNAADGEMALKIWTLKEDEPGGSLLASHNLAVFWHLVALDWEKRLAEADVDIEMTRSIEEYWQMSAKRWTALMQNDAFWDLLNQRIQLMNDPRLTLQFGQSLRRSLPEALIKINAELALRHFESGHKELGALHVRLVKAMVSDASKIDAVLQSVMGPTIDRLQQQSRRVRQSSEEHPEFSARSIKELVEQVVPLHSVYRLMHGEDSPLPDAEVFVQTAILCTNAAVAFHRATRDNAGFVHLLERILPIAITPELRQRIELNISIGKANLERDRFKPLLDTLDKVRNSTAQSKSRLWRVQEQVITPINSLDAAERESNPAILELRDAAASILLWIATEALKRDNDRQTAAEAAELAGGMANRLDLKEQILALRASLPSRSSPTDVNSEKKRLSLEDLNKRLEELQSVSSPADRLAKIKGNILNDGQKWNLQAEDVLAGELRKLSLLAFNEYCDADTAWEAIEMAVNLARDPENASRFRDDSESLARLRAVLEQEALMLAIRDDTIQITAQKIRINDHVWPTAAIAGLRYGEQEDRRTYRIDLQTLGGELIPLDCKRFLRSERKAAEDFAQITQALRQQVAPRIAWRAARHVLNSGSYPFYSSGCYDFVHDPPAKPELLLLPNAIVTTGIPGIPEIKIPLDDAVIESGERGSFLRSKSAPPIRVSALWNGCCLDLFLNTLKNAQKHALPSYARSPE